MYMLCGYVRMCGLYYNKTLFYDKKYKTLYLKKKLHCLLTVVLIDEDMFLRNVLRGVLNI